MAQIILSEAGASLGRRAFANGINLAGVGLSGASLGRSAGAFIGRAIDQAFADPREGPRVASLHIMESREGAGIPSVYGRMRVGGQLIWASCFREQRRVERVGGKGGTKQANYTYSVSLAVALGEGNVSAVRQAFANGEAFDLSSVTHRFYGGDETQLPDPLIDMLEGTAPAYRGIAYIVFEDLPLEAFGNRLPQFSFEIERAPPSSEASLASVVTAVNIIPASGEFVYATEVVREVLAPGVERAINVNSGEARADFLLSMDQLSASLPNVNAAALTVGWFGTSIDAGQCAIAPGVETRTRTTRPRSWSVAGLTRANAHLISRDASGALHYGGTPDDQSVIAAIQALKARGQAVTLTPFLFMDSPGLPWRGRIGVTNDKTQSARTSIETFVSRTDGYRRFILHHAVLAAEAGGVDAFLIGSEMRGLTRVRDHNGAFPFVEALIALAHEVKTILPNARISYAADWTEYGAYAPGDGTNDVLFPLDPLWASSAVDFIGVDWYPPMGDWRDGNAHIDALAGFKSADDPAYLTAQLTGGEAFDWHYASDAHRLAQIRTPIIDTAHAEHWIFRAKDISAWAANAHYPRPGGVRTLFPTAFQPAQKPIRFCEIGFGAIDKGGNAPNLFVDPKSTESGMPPFSSGARDDLFQTRALSTVLPLIAANALIASAHVWAWDARPFPAWPLRKDVWSDGENWARGHWLNGRAGLSSLGAVVQDLCTRAGVTHIDVSALDGAIEGYSLDGPMALRGALEALRLAFGFDVIERNGNIVFQMQAQAAQHAISPGDWTEPGPRITDRLLDKAPERLRLIYLDANADFAPAIAEARTIDGDPRLVSDVSLPLALTPMRAQLIAAHLLDLRRLTRTREGALPGTLLQLEPGDTLMMDDGEVWRIDQITDANFERQVSLAKNLVSLAPHRTLDPGAPPPTPAIASAPDFVIIDAPDADAAPDGPLVASFADPWPDEIVVQAGSDGGTLTTRVTLNTPALIARVLFPVFAGPHGRLDRAHQLYVTAPYADVQSITRADLLAGANTAYLETSDGWECLQFQTADLIAPDQWRLSNLLRGLAGTSSGEAIAGARLVFRDAAIQRASFAANDWNAELLWRAGRHSTPQTYAYAHRAGLPWPVAHLRRRAHVISWTRRGADVPDNWTLPEASNDGRFTIERDFGSGFQAPIEQAAASIPITPGLQRVRIAAVGADGRNGPARELALT